MIQDSTYTVAKDILGKLGGDVTVNYDSTYSVAKAILEKMNGGGGGGTGDGYSKDETNALLAKKQNVLTAGTGIGIENDVISVTLDTQIFKIVETLPTKEKDIDTNKIYMVPSTTPEGENIYTEYVYIKKTFPLRSHWEVLGEYHAEINLDDYLSKAEATPLFEAKADKADTYTKQEVNDAINTHVPDLKDYYKKTETYSQTEVNEKLDLKADKSDTYTKKEVDDAITAGGSGALENYYDKPTMDGKLAEKVDNSAFETFQVSNTEEINKKANSADVYSITDADKKFRTKADSYSQLEVNEKLKGKVDNGTYDAFVEQNAIELSNKEAKGFAYSKEVSDEKYRTIADSYSQTEINNKLNDKLNASEYTAFQKQYVIDLEKKQDTLVSGKNIKTINDQDIIGSGNIVIPKGETGPQGPEGPQGPAGEPGIQGERGLPGEDGYTPHIGDNGNWFLNDIDTGKPSRGEKGEPGLPGKDSTVPGPVGPQGPAGENGVPGERGPQGYTPEIGTNGNWFINGEDTGKPSRGEKGEPGGGGSGDLKDYYKKTETYNQTQVDTINLNTQLKFDDKLKLKADASNVYTIEQIDAMIGVINQKLDAIIG